MTHDRATVVTQVLVDALVDAMTTIIRTEFRRRFTEVLCDEFRDERQQAAADRAPPDPRDQGAEIAAFARSRTAMRATIQRGKAS
jgi:hypothetical protein